MKKIFTTLLFIMVALTTSTTVKAQAVQGADRDKISQTMMNLLNEWDRDAYVNILDLLGQMLDYDMGGLVQYAYQQLEGMKTPLADGKGNNIYLRPSAFLGHYKVVDNKWVREGDADDLQLSFTDRQGNPCVARLTMTGAKKSFTVDDVEGMDEEDWEKMKEKNYVFYKIMWGLKDVFEGVTQMTMELSEHTTFTFNQGNKEMAHANLDFDLSTLKDNWTIMDGMMFSADLSFAQSNGQGTFDIIVNQTGYKPGTGINIDFTAKKTGKDLISFKLSAPGTFSGINMSSMSDLSFGFESMNFDIDVLGQIQVKGGIPNISAFMMALIMSMSSGGDDADESRKMLGDLSSAFTANIYYDHKPEVAGSFTVVPTNVDGNINLVPMIQFTSDDSSYPVTSYFTKENFPEVALKAAEIVTEAQELIEIIKRKAGDPAGLYSRIKNKNTQESEVFNLAGIKTQESVSSLPKGVYMIKTKTGTRKFVKR